MASDSDSVWEEEEDEEMVKISKKRRRLQRKQQRLEVVGEDVAAPGQQQGKKGAGRKQRQPGVKKRKVRVSKKKKVAAVVPKRKPFPWKMVGAPRGNHGDRATKLFPGLPRVQAWLQQLKVCTSFAGRAVQLLKAATSGSMGKRKTAEKKKNPDSVAVAKKKCAWWKDILISGVFSAALYYGGVDLGVVSAVDNLCACLRWMSSPTIVESVRCVSNCPVG